MYSIKSEKMFGGCISSFELTPLKQGFYLVPIDSRILIGGVLGMFNGVFFRGAVAIGILAMELIATAAI